MITAVGQLSRMIDSWQVWRDWWGQVAMAAVASLTLHPFCQKSTTTVLSTIYIYTCIFLLWLIELLLLLYKFMDWLIDWLISCADVTDFPNPLLRSRNTLSPFPRFSWLCTTYLPNHRTARPHLTHPGNMFSVHWTRWCIPVFGSSSWLLLVEYSTFDSFAERNSPWNTRKSSASKRQKNAVSVMILWSYRLETNLENCALDFCGLSVVIP